MNDDDVFGGTFTVNGNIAGRDNNGKLLSLVCGSVRCAAAEEHRDFPFENG